MQTQILNYRIIISADTQTGTGTTVYTAQCPTLGVADDGDTIEQAIHNVRGAIEAYIEDLQLHGEEIPKDHPETDIVTTASIVIPFQGATYAQNPTSQTA